MAQHTTVVVYSFLHFVTECYLKRIKRFGIRTGERSWIFVSLQSATGSPAEDRAKSLLRSVGTLGFTIFDSQLEI